uniref:non-specific serine/threonine protein kinase n=1 Tax=Kwoniella dejecticola CBS 10117 TaxID=1296121 RepID=A0A1A6AF42_9TREE|nr:phosphatidylinositol 3-kinase [Kwoniella dejecticola CBS 10117]OBR88676.1 phosphatidylinositol 3-kinase [Kwoniella dejecticola CBS 10117]
MSGNPQYHITHRMVPLICQALIAAPEDETVWLEGLRMLANPKLKQALTLTSSIWLPLLLRGLETAKTLPVIISALNLLNHVAEILEPMKSCLLKPLRALGREKQFENLQELVRVVEKLDLTVWNNEKKPIGRPRSARTAPNSQANTPLPSGSEQTHAQKEQHPLLAEILAHNLPPKSRTVQQAWSQTLLSSAHDNPNIWLHNLYQATLEASNVPELVVASKLGPLIHEELFQTAFVKCYVQLETDQAFKDLVDNALACILKDPSVSQEITVVVLELMAFFNKDRREFGPMVHEAAKKCALENFDGALNSSLPGIVLWYAEQNAEAFPIQENIANLVETNISCLVLLTSLSGYDAAWSTLLWLEKDWNVEPEPIWITQLSHWQQALDSQDRLDQKSEGTTFSSFNTKMICYHALGCYQQGYELAQNLFEGLNDLDRRNTAHWATAAAWHMGDFETMADYLAFHPKGTSKSLYKAIIDVHNGQYASAFHHISKAQSLSYDEVQVQLDVGPQVAHRSLAKTELLVELQEVIQYKSQPELRDNLVKTWKTRFQKSHADPNTWLKRLELWTLACPPTTSGLQSCFIECAKHCESAGMHQAAENILKKITPAAPPLGCKVEYTRFRFEWKKAYQQHDLKEMDGILQRLIKHTQAYMEHIGVNQAELESQGLGLHPLTVLANCGPSDHQILSRRYFRIAEWTAALQGSDWITDDTSQVLKYTALASKIDDNWYAAGFALAERSLAIFEANDFSRSDPVAVSSYVVPAIRGLFLSARTKENPEFVIKALLRLVTLWFRFGESTAVLGEVENQLSLTPVDPWLSAIPQLIARLGTPHRDLQHTLINLLKSISSQYPHAVIWPLLTATQTSKVEHQEAARVIMSFICTMSDGIRLVDQAELVGKELIRTSASLMERWRGVIEKIIPRTELMETPWHEVPMIWAQDIQYLQAPETPDEEQFVQIFGEQLIQIDKSLRRYRSNKQISIVNYAYQELYKLYGDLEVQINQWKQPGSKLYLSSTAPRLLSLRDCVLTVPGQYDPNLKLDDQAFIDSFEPVVDILSSKQLPRKLVIRSYTADHTFLLKGNEDLRGDERIMQLFNLINTMLNHNSDAFSRNLHLLPYEVIPLSPSAGLVSWVSNTQQLQSMIMFNRAKNKQQSLNDKETASLLAEMDKYDKLPIATKVQRLKACLAHSKQSDLKDVLWQKSPSSDIWIRRRTNFARTVGVSSFVGSIIGLGDRHGSNILIDQLTWGALHIDFGDLFNVAQERSFLPEKVPFRLTRMMTNAFELASRGGLEVPGTRGTFKQASLIVMNVLRDSRSTVLAMLEAFLYDPLLSWTVSGNEKQRAESGNTHLTDFCAQRPPVQMHVVPQSLAPGSQGGTGSDIYDRIENSLITTYLETDSYMAKVSSGTGMTNSKALQVLSQIEKKLIGYHKDTEQPLTINRQVQALIEEATDLKNLSQGYVLGWIPQW